jgi:DNA repair exonuclease SbcCD ATPase subunit
VLADAARAALLAEQAALGGEGTPAADAPTAAAEPAESPAGDPAALERELEDVRRGLIEMHARVGGREGRSAARVCELLADREVKLAALARARSFKAAVELARDRFQTVARETHAKWSEHVDGRVDELLSRFGLPHAGFRLSDRLEPSLALDGERHAGLRLEQSLSTGARDQVTLALRLAICEFLARGGAKLPLLLDDPLAHADDARSARLLRVLAEAAQTGHQVILLTCHRATIDALQAEDPEWFAARVVTVDFDRTGAARLA